MWRRKLQQMGGSHTITLPAEWIREQGIPPGTDVAIQRCGDGNLHIAGHQNDSDVRREITLWAGISLTTISAFLSAAFVTGDRHILFSCANATVCSRAHIAIVADTHFDILSKTPTKIEAYSSFPARPVCKKLIEAILKQLDGQLTYLTNFEFLEGDSLLEYVTRCNNLVHRNLALYFRSLCSINAGIADVRFIFLAKNISDAFLRFAHVLVLLRAELFEREEDILHNAILSLDAYCQTLAKYYTIRYELCEEQIAALIDLQEGICTVLTQFSSTISPNSPAQILLIETDSIVAVLKEIGEIFVELYFTSH